MITDYDNHVWLEDLIWCPSQIYYYFTDPLTNKDYVLYLRWRHQDPWTSELIEIDRRGDWVWSSSLKITGNSWFKEDNYKELEKACYKRLTEMFPHIEFTEPKDE